MLLFVLSACVGEGSGHSAAGEVSTGASTPASEPVAEDPSEPSEEPTPEEADLPDPAEVGANELGEIPILMYHRVMADATSDYDRTPEEFRADLEYLYEHDYRPVRVVDVVDGRIDIPAGTSPVVMTFDDSTREQFAYEPDGAISPDTAIGVLLAFAEEHPDFTPVASMYVNAYAFGGGGDSDDILQDLHERGFELGNHTAGHANLGASSDDDIARELAQGVSAITDAVAEAEVRTLSLPLGIWPDPRELAYSGSWEGQSYQHEGILLVGANPAPSPFHADFDPLAIPRIRASTWDGGDPDYGSGFWLDVLERHEDRRYVSDGDADRISFPAERADQLDPRFTDRGNPY